MNPNEVENKHILTNEYTPDDYYERRVSHFARLSVELNDIVMLGDSLIDGCEWHELLNNAHVKNRGINSDTIEGVRQRLQCISQGKPAKIFLMIGINDVSHNKDAHTIAHEITQIAIELHRQSPSTRLYIHSLLPFDTSIHYHSLAGKEDIVDEINSLLNAHAHECDYTFINIHPHFLAHNETRIDKMYTNDGLHLNGCGYALWRELILPYIHE